MTSEYTRKANTGLLAGLAMQIAGALAWGVGEAMFVDDGSAFFILCRILIVVGIALQVWGCAYYARNKGQSPWLGLLALLNFVGLVILMVLPDRVQAQTARA